MSAFRGSDDDLEREIATVERLVRVRLNRANRDLRELDGALAELRRERRRRRLEASVATLSEEPTAAAP